VGHSLQPERRERGPAQRLSQQEPVIFRRSPNGGRCICQPIGRWLCILQRSIALMVCEQYAGGAAIILDRKEHGPGDPDPVCR